MSSSISSGKIPSSCLLYALRAAAELSSSLAYLLLRLFSFTSGVAFFFLFLFIILAECSAVLKKLYLAKN